MSVALVLHLLFAVIWVGGMFFAYLCLRPATGLLDPPVRARLWAATLTRFFRWVWVTVGVLLVSGLYMVHVRGSIVAGSPYIYAMIVTGIVMMLLFAYIFFVPFRRLKRAVAAGDFATAELALRRIRALVGFNLLLGLMVLIAAVGGQVPY